MFTTRILASSVTLAVFALLWAAPDAATAQVIDRPAQYRAVHVSGEGTTRVDPDQATVQFGIVSRADDPNEARRQNEQASRDALNAVRELGIPERKIQMQTLRLQPVRDRDPETRQMVERGYEAVRQVSVELDDIDLVPVVVAEVVQHGANRLQGVRYDRADRVAARNAALQAATADARSKAEVLAQSLGASLGEVVQINEQSYRFPRPMVRMEAAMAMDDMMDNGDPAAYAPGEIEVSAEVQVSFVLR